MFSWDKQLIEIYKSLFIFYQAGSFSGLDRDYNNKRSHEFF